MANWTALKAAVAAVIKTNGNQEITGALLQSTLNSIISNVGENATFKGIAVPTTVPGTPDGNIFYIASAEGIYTNFGGIELILNEVAIIKNETSNTWVKLKIMQIPDTQIYGLSLMNEYKIPGFVRMDNGQTQEGGTYIRTSKLNCYPGEYINVVLPDNSVAGLAFYDSNDVFISGINGEGKDNCYLSIIVPDNISYFMTCKMPDNILFLYRHINGSISKQVQEQLQLLNGKSNTFDLAKELLYKDIIIVPAGIHNVTSTINIPSNKKIYGIRGKSFLKASGVDCILSLNSVTNIEINGINILGEWESVNFEDTSKISNITQALAENGKGAKDGIRINDCSKILIHNCNISNFDYRGIYATIVGTGYNNGISIDNCSIQHNYIGIKTYGCEYSFITKCDISENHIGYVNGSANEVMGSCSISKNVVGGIIDALYINNGHGNISNTLINHCTVFGLVVNAIDSGYILNALQVQNIAVGSIGLYIKSANGILITSCDLLNGITVENGGGVAINSNVFRVNTSIITLIGTTHVKKSGNIYADGTTPTLIND